MYFSTTFSGGHPATNSVHISELIIKNLLKLHPSTPPTLTNHSLRGGGRAPVRHWVHLLPLLLSDVLHQVVHVAISVIETHIAVFNARPHPQIP